jgi:hypothetical protein
MDIALLDELSDPNAAVIQTGTDNDMSAVDIFSLDLLLRYWEWKSPHLVKGGHWYPAKSRMQMSLKRGHGS